MFFADMGWVVWQDPVCPRTTSCVIIFFGIVSTSECLQYLLGAFFHASSTSTQLKTLQRGFMQCNEGLKYERAGSCRGASWLLTFRTEGENDASSGGSSLYKVNRVQCNEKWKVGNNCKDLLMLKGWRREYWMGCWGAHYDSDSN